MLDLRIRQWEKLRYLDSERILRGLRQIATSKPLHTLPYQVSSLRRRDLRFYGEGRQAALFCYAMSQVAGVPVAFAQLEASDYDVIARYVIDDTAHYVPIQLKELVPDQVNPHADLQAELSKIGKYVDSHELVVAFHLNSERHIDFSTLSFPVGTVGELWFFGATTRDQRKWVLIGNMLRQERFAYEFTYPGA
jgi:hypothetical protein